MKVCNLCAFCERENETVEHILFYYEFCRAFWLSCYLQLNLANLECTNFILARIIFANGFENMREEARLKKESSSTYGGSGNAETIQCLK